MSFSKVKTWDNRFNGRLGPNGKCWTRRIQWLEEGGTGSSQIKLKLEDETALTANLKAMALMGEAVPADLQAKKVYREVLVLNPLDANIIWERFKQGQSVDDCVSFLGAEVPKGFGSKRARSK